MPAVEAASYVYVLRKHILSTRTLQNPENKQTCSSFVKIKQIRYYLLMGKLWIGWNVDLLAFS